MNEKFETLYPKTPECDSYLQTRKKHEAESLSRARWQFAGAILGNASAINAVDSEEFRRLQLENHDCQMSALRLFSAKKVFDEMESNTDKNSPPTRPL